MIDPSPGVERTRRWLVDGLGSGVMRQESSRALSTLGLLFVVIVSGCHRAEPRADAPCRGGPEAALRDAVERLPDDRQRIARSKWEMALRGEPSGERTISLTDRIKLRIVDEIPVGEFVRFEEFPGPFGGWYRSIWLLSSPDGIRCVRTGFGAEEITETKVIAEEWERFRRSYFRGEFEELQSHLVPEAHDEGLAYVCLQLGDEGRAVITNEPLDAARPSGLYRMAARLKSLCPPE